ncbi:MAG: glutamyl-tRNA reductase [Halobacteriaceae archaeon]
MSTRAVVVTSVRVTHADADLADIEAIAPTDDRAAVTALHEERGIQEALLLATCHRVEAYVVASDRETGEAALRAILDPGPVARWAGHRDSLRHLLAVGAGLDSAVLGEDQILGQLKAAAETAREADALGPMLDAAAMKAAHVGERARTETAINDGVVSLGSAAARFAARTIDLDEDTAVVVGAGEMGRLAAKALADTDGITRVVVANRTEDRAQTVAAALPVPARATGLEELAAPVTDAAVVVTATASPTPVVDTDVLAAAGDTLIVDLGRPPDVTDDTPAPVTVYDLDDIEAVTDQAVDRRREAASAVESMVDAELHNLIQHLKRQRADEVIAAMYESADTVKRRELETALSRLGAAGDLTDDQEAIVADLADALVSQLLAAPTRSLRDAAAEDDWETIHTALQLFDPEFGDNSPFAESFPDAVDVADSPGEDD